MSTYAYGAITRMRRAAPAKKSTNEKPPGTGTYIDALAALVPAEVLAAHAIILTFTTKTDAGQTTVTEAAPLRAAFWALMCVAALIYALGRRGAWDRWDFARLLIPPLAFAGWTMLGKATAFDAVAPGWSSGTRQTYALLGAVVLTAVGAALGMKADQADWATVVDQGTPDPLLPLVVASKESGLPVEVLFGLILRGQLAAELGFQEGWFVRSSELQRYLHQRLEE
jgi:hypothetical protein